MLAIPALLAVAVAPPPYLGSLDAALPLALGVLGLATAVLVAYWRTRPPPSAPRSQRRHTLAVALLALVTLGLALYVGVLLARPVGSARAGGTAADDWAGAASTAAAPAGPWQALLARGQTLLARARGEQPHSSVAGVLVDLRAQSIVHTESLTLRDDNGRLWHFRVSPEVATDPEEPQTAAHLRQHMALGERLLVRYHANGEDLVAVQVRDLE